jgi:hypothetical protein
MVKNQFFNFQKLLSDNMTILKLRDTYLVCFTNNETWISRVVIEFEK